MAGISKRELLEDYFPDEIPVVLREWAALKKGKQGTQEQTEAVSGEAFFGF